MKLRLLGSVLAGILFTAHSDAQTMLGITSSNSIFTMADVHTPSSISGPYAVSGVASGQALVALSSRNSDARLYALGYDSTSNTAQLYWLSGTGSSITANAVGSATTSMNLGTTNNVAMSFIASVSNQIRITARNGNNYIMNADNGTVMATGSSSYSYASGDLYSSASSTVVATGYTNNFFGSDATTQVGYDAVNNVLVTFDPGNYANGFDNASYTMHSVGVTTGIVFTAGSSIGMDTWYDSITHTNTAYISGNTLLGGSHLYSYALNGAGTGSLTDMGTIGSGSLNVRAITFAKYRDSVSTITGQLTAALTLNLRNIVWFDSYNPGNIRRMVTISGMTAGQNMIAIDYSPFSGALYGLGYNSTAQTYQLYTIDATNGHATAVNTTAASLSLGTDAGSGNHINASFRFIPTLTDRIRIIGNNGNTNVQISSTTGLVTSTDASLQYVTGDSYFGSTANITSIAFTGFNGDTATQGFGFDANTGAMVTFNTDNSASGWGDGASGYISTNISLDAVLSLLLHTSTFNNSYMDIAFDNSTSTNVGFMGANYYGDSSAQLNYSVLYDMSAMLSGYHKATSTDPTMTGTVGKGIPVKDISVYKTPVPTLAGNVNVVANGYQFYPNPVISTAKIILPVASVGDVTVDVIDLNGYIIRSFSYGPQSYQLDVDMSELPTGLYSVRVFGKGVAYHNIKVVKVD